MYCLQTPFGFVLTLSRRDELIRSLILFARNQEIDAATVSGIGSVEYLELGCFHLSGRGHQRRVFQEELEACTINGSLSLLDGEPFPHLHGVFSRHDYSTIGGHIFEAVPCAGLEVVIQTIPEPIVRENIEGCNLKPMKLGELP